MLSYPADGFLAKFRLESVVEANLLREGA